MKVDEILLRRKNKVSLPANPAIDFEFPDKVDKAMVVSMIKNVEAYGFTFSKELIENLLTYTREDLETFYFDLIPKLKKLVGADKEYHPMYPNFPKQIMEASEIELYVNAIFHYLTCGKWFPKFEKNPRLPVFDSSKMRVLSVGYIEDIWDILINLVGSKTSISSQDKEDIAQIVKDYPEFYKHLPDEIPLKENAALVAKIISDNAAIKHAKYIDKYFKTATDVLRYVVMLSEGDVSLASKTIFRSLRRYERRMVMDLLAGCGDILEDMYRYKYEWIRVGEIVHPSEFKARKYDNVRNAFYTLRNEHKPLFIPGMVQAAISGKDMHTAAAMLMNRPGDFARQLDKMLRDADDKNYVVNCFKEISSKVSTPVLLQVRQHFLKRNPGDPVRVFFPKGNLARAIVSRNKLPPIDEKICTYIVKICNKALVEQYRSRDFMGAVYIDDDFKNYLVPFSQRSASSANKTIVRGSSVPIRKNAKAVRAFVWWTNTQDEDRVDIDLSAAIYDADWGYVDHISYTRLRSNYVMACHSGDITNGGDSNGKGVAEFLDVDIDAVAKKGRYIVYQVYSFTRQKFSSLPNCRFGWMEREDVNSGEIFEPSTVNMSMDVTADSMIAIPVIFDCKERKFIWCDMNLSIDKSSYCFGNNLESNLSGVSATCYGMTHLNKPNLYDLIMLNAMARGTTTNDRNQADIIFSNDITSPVEIIEAEDETTGKTCMVLREKKDIPIITAFDVDYFMGKLL